MNLDDIVQIGYKKTNYNFASLEIWENGNSRVLYNPEEKQVVIEYDVNSDKGIEFEKVYLNEVD